MTKRLVLLGVVLVLVFGVFPANADGPTTKTYAPVTTNGFRWLDTTGPEWDLTQGDLIVSFKLDMSGYAPPLGTFEWSRLGIAKGNTERLGWMEAAAPYAAEALPETQDLDDKLVLGAGPDRYDEMSYDVIGPGIVVPPIGNPWANYGVWFDRTGVDEWQAKLWGMQYGWTYETGGVYRVVLTYRAVNADLGTMFATVNGAQTGFYRVWKNAQPDYYPVGKTIHGDLTKVRLFVALAGQNVKANDIQATGYPRKAAKK